jgi:hypothetical protein
MAGRAFITDQNLNSHFNLHERTVNVLEGRLSPSGGNGFMATGEMMKPIFYAVNGKH